MKKRILCALCCIALLVCLPVMALAHEVPDYDRLGSLSVDMTYQGKPVSGGTLTLYRVGDIAEDDGNYFYILVPELEGFGLSLEDLYDADTAAYMVKVVKQEKLQGISQKIDKQGNALFEDLPIGLYLVVQTKASAGYNAAAPFLIGIPNRIDDRYVYAVDASPKVELEKAPTETTEPPTETTVPGKLPQTGQNNWPVPVMLIAGLLFIACGVLLQLGGRDKDHET